MVASARWNDLVWLRIISGPRRRAHTARESAAFCFTPHPAISILASVCAQYTPGLECQNRPADPRGSPRICKLAQPGVGRPVNFHPEEMSLVLEAFQGGRPARN